MESGRRWEPNWGDLPVVLQRNISFAGSGTSDVFGTTRHSIPYDTLPQQFDTVPTWSSRTKWACGHFRRRCTRRLSEDSIDHMGNYLRRDGEEAGKPDASLVAVKNTLLSAADAVFVSGESGARYIRRFGVDSSKLFFIPFTTGMAPFLATPVAREAGIRHRLIYSGTLTERRGCCF